jgi:transaldolase/transaldolase/glucose-6-phosphate isomerase
MDSRLKKLDEQGQSIWLDFVSHGLIVRGELKQLIDDGVQGLTSNPSIFEKAVAQSDDYKDLFERLAPEKLSPTAFFDRLAVRDIQDAADLFRPVYDRTHGVDGYVSIEVSPKIALDGKASLEEARRLWKLVNRPNVMVKIPGTAEGLPAIEQALKEGININITLLFAQERYADVAEAYLRALEDRVKRGEDISRLASVASFFVSRIDSLVDKTIDQKLAQKPGAEEAKRLESLHGKVAIANAKLAYQHFLGLTRSDRWKALEAKGARPQRLLWASTSTKNPKYRDVLYIEELIGGPTVNTVPMGTLDAFREHGEVRASLLEDVDGAKKTMADLEAAGISMKQVTDQLVTEGVKLFDEAFDKLLAAIAGRLSKGGA